MSKRSSELYSAVLKLVDANSNVHEFHCAHPKGFKHYEHVHFLYNENRTAMYALKWNNVDNLLSLRNQ